MIEFVEKDGGLIFSARVAPNASRSAVVGELRGILKIKINAAPVEGAANAELKKLLAEFFRVPKSAVEILKGQTSKNKQIKILGLNAANLPDLKSA